MGIIPAFVPSFAALSRRVPAEEPDLILDFRTDRHGRRYLYFPFATFSDSHLGTRMAEAKLICRMLTYLRVDTLRYLGDGIDGADMHEKGQWNWGRWHRQVLGHLFRMADEGTDVEGVPGNHDDRMCMKTIIFNGMQKLHRNMCGKAIGGVKVVEESRYVDPRDGHRITGRHGHEYDASLKGSGVGNAIVNWASYIDLVLCNLPKGLRISIVAEGQKLTRTVIDFVFQTQAKIARDLDLDPSTDVLITGHTHKAGMWRTPGGKLMINDGSGAELAVKDANGTYGNVKWFEDGISVKQEGKSWRFRSWDELGEPSFKNEPLLLENQYTALADRVIRLIYRMWPPKERQRYRKNKRLGEAAQKTTYWESAGSIPLPNRRHILRQFKTATVEKPNVLEAV